jgi:hypothetical protein
MSQESAKLPFDNVAADLPDNNRAEFYRILHETGISPNDIELARLLKALQLYKAYYESIPAAVRAAAGEIDRLKQDIEQLGREIRESLDAGTQLVGQVVLESQRVHGEISGINSQIDDAFRVSTEGLTSRMTKYLTAGLEKSVVPLEKRLTQLAVSNRDFDDAIDRNVRATAALEKSTAAARRFHVWTYTICGFAAVCSLVLGSWLHLHRQYEARIEAEQKTLVNQFEQNRAVLLQLSKAHRTLEFQQDPKRPNLGFLVMKDAAGWQSANNQGVIQFKK